MGVEGSDEYLTGIQAIEPLLVLMVVERQRTDCTDHLYSTYVYIEITWALEEA
jgi:hypothetical protein